MPKPQAQLKIWVNGHVQGVGFRYATQVEAQKCKLTGWVKNLSDGRVAILVQGKEKYFQGFMDWCQHGPGNAKVEGIEVEKTPVDEVYESFEIHQ